MRWCLNLLFFLIPCLLLYLFLLLFLLLYRFLLLFLLLNLYVLLRRFLVEVDHVDVLRAPTAHAAGT